MKQGLKKIGLAIGIVSLLLAVWAIGVSAQGTSKEVGLVVQYGDGRLHQEIVRAPANATTLEILEASSLDIVTADYGGGFIALCKIGADGCPADDCFCATESWAFWILNAAGPAWESAMVGIAGHTPAQGDVVGFSWTGFDSSWNALVQPPVRTFQQIQDATAPNEIPEPATLLLLGSGVAGLAGYIGLRRRAR